MGDFKSKTDIPKYGFKVKLNHEYPEKRTPYFKPSLRIIWDLLPMFLRYIYYYIVYRIKKKSVVMDYLFMSTAKRMYGVPIGGIGSGTIGRGYKGEFCRFQLRPNACEYNTVDANQFIVTIKDQSDATIFQSCLSTYTKTSLPSWQSLLDGNKCYYTGLYPRAWSYFDLSEFGIKLTCRQISPVIPHDYENSCMPCAVFVWNVENIGDEERSVTISFTFKNGTGSKKADKETSCSSKAFSYQNLEGVILYHKLDKMQCSYSLGVKAADGVAISKCLHFDPNSNGSVVWNQLKDNGQFDKIKGEPSKTHHIFGEMAVGVSAKSKLLGNTSQSFEMVLAWDMPSIIYPVGQNKYFRFYTEKFGKENAALKIVNHALQNYPMWEDKIYEWQKPILDDGDLPDWYKSALFNESYFLSDGGTVWLSLEEEFAKTLNTSDSRKKYGRFAYLEGHEYRMYNSYDVHFYASHALSKNFPELQKSLQYDLRDYIFLEVPDKMKMVSDGKTVERKKPNTVPHDTGDPGESPFILINAYPIEDVSTWKDLSSKFVLQTFRDAIVGNVVDTTFIQDMYKACDIVMRKLLVFDYDQDGLIENSGKPDQTYDTWVMKGASSYCGGLWLAAVYAMTEMAVTVGNTDDKDFYQDILDRGIKAFQKKLWNGQYYNFDCSTDQCKSIMADQLNAQWYLGCIGKGHDYPVR
uniref:NLGase n=1 Tax=Dendroctonus ponderosae TaxID=77166 RepID=A0AAR5P6H3_DENPD